MQMIGAGRIGTSLKRRAQERGMQLDLIGRQGGDFERTGPLLVATRNDDLPAVLERVPTERHADLVFLQNGWLWTWLERVGLADNGRGLLYFAATERDGTIDPGTTSWFTGPHADAVAAWFNALDLEAAAVDRASFAEVELEKLAWLCVFGPLCQVHGCTVGEAIDQHAEQLTTLCHELARFGEVVGVHVPPAALEAGLVRYSRTIPTYRASVKEWAWRNGAVLDVLEEAGIRSPLQRELTDRARRPSHP